MIEKGGLPRLQHCPQAKPEKPVKGAERPTLATKD